MWPKSWDKNHVCFHPVNTSMVTGEILGESCTSMREDSCYEEALLFEPKEDTTTMSNNTHCPSIMDNISTKHY